MSYYARFIFFTWLTTAILMATVGFVQFRDQKDRELARLTAKADLLAESFRLAAASALAMGRTEDLHPLALRLVADPEVAGVSVTDADGRTVLSYQVGASGPAEQTLVRSEALEVEDRSAGTVTLAFTSAPLGSDLARDARRLVASWLLVGSTIILVAMVASRHAREAMEQVIRGIRQVNQEDFSARLSMKGTAEFSDLARQFNLMVERLRMIQVRNRSYLAQIEDKNRQLEREIEIRETAEAALLQTQKMEAIGRLAGGIAHDFNNLLTTILGCADLVKSTLDPEAEELEDVEAIIAAASRARDLTSQLLLTARKGTLRSEPVGLNDVVLGVEKLLRRTLGSSIEVVIGLHPNDPHVLGDRAALEQVVMNLSINARDAMPDGGRLDLRVGTVRLDARACDGHPDRVPGRYATVTVQDTGTGMPEDIRQKVFEPFFTTKKPGHGTGLGLAMAYATLQQSHGFIDLQSEVGVGTTITLYLPRVEEGESDAPVVQPLDDLRGTETVLVAEDDPPVRQVAVRFLRRLGYQVIEAKSSEHAIALGRQIRAPIHLVFSDVVMPGLHGPELVQRLRGIRGDFKVLYTSGFSPDRLADFGIEGEDPLLPKPYGLRDLAMALRKVLEAGAPPAP